MSTEEIEKTLTPVFRDVLDDEDLVLRPDLSAKDVPTWDSLTHIRLLLTVERAFKVTFSTTEVGDLKNVGELIELIRKKTSAS